MIGAAGAIESGDLRSTIQNGVIPPTINYVNPDPGMPTWTMSPMSPKSRCKNNPVQYFGFGGITRR